MMIPTSWVPYLLIILGIFGTVVLATKGGSDTGDTISGIVVCVLCAIGGAVWLVIKNKKNKS